MNNKIIFLLFLTFSSSFAQTFLLNENPKGNKLQLIFNSTLNYSIEKNGVKNIFHISDFEDESSPGDVKLPSNEIFISLPKVEIPKIKYNIISKKIIKAIPEFNDEVKLNAKKEVIYNRSTSIKNSKAYHYKVKGYLWTGNNYCLHLEVNPAVFISSQNVIELVNEFEVELEFENNISLQKIQVEKKNNIISNRSYNLSQNKTKYKINDSDSWIDYSKEYVKLGTAKDGIYRIGKSNLESIGISTSSINPKSFKMILKGEEIPIFVKGEDDLSFDDTDFIEFVGIRNMGGHHRELSGYDEPYNEYLGRYTDTTIYWLTWDGIDGERVEISDGNDVNTTDTLDYYSQVEHYEKNNWFDFSCSSLVRRETPYWIENKTWVEGQLHVGKVSKNFVLTNVYPNRIAKIYAKLQDYASNISNNAHHLALGINNNGHYYDSTYIDKYEKIVLSAQFNSNNFINGTNSIQVHSFQTDATLNSCATDWYEIEYPRYLIPTDNSLNFTFSFLSEKTAKMIKLQSVNTENFVLWEYGDNYKKYNLSRSGTEILFSDSLSSKSKFLFVDESKINTPKIYYKKEFVNLRSSENKADYIAITHKKFKNKVNDYAQFIAEGYGIDTKVVDIDDIYDEYGYGFFNPEVIKDFLKSTHNNWKEPKPKSVALIGGATYDYYGNKYRNFSAVTKRVLNYVPSFGASVSDNWFVVWDTTGAYIPQINIGRIPVTTNEELDWYFEKHKNYVSQEYDEWNKTFLFFSGGKLTKPSELNSMREANQFVIDNYTNPKPIGGNSIHFYKTLEPVTNFGPYSLDYIQSKIDDGAVYISYVGHSGTRTWDNSITNPSRLKNNKGRYPVVSDFGCSTGRFAEPDVISFSQLFTLDSEGQALGYIGNSSLGFVSTSLLMPKYFYKKILKENIHTVSEAHKEAKIELLQSYGSTGIYELFSLTNTLIGDPLLSLPIPDKPNFIMEDKNICLQSDILTDLQDSAKVRIDIINWGYVPSDTLEILLIHKYLNLLDSNIVKIEIPSFKDSLFVKIPIKNMVGNHLLNIILDPNNMYDEISKDDNKANFEFYVASSSIRPLLISQFFNGVNKISFLNSTSIPVNESIEFEVSQDNQFNTSRSFVLSFDSVLTTFEAKDLGNYRYWGRTKIKGTNNYSTVFSFSKNFNKYVLFDSLGFALSSVNKLDIDTKSTLKIDSSRFVFDLLSEGFFDGRTALIKLNKVNFISESTKTGHHICLFNRKTFEFAGQKLFDVSNGDATTISNYINFIDTVSSKYYIAFTVADNGAISDQTLKNKLKSLGSKYIDSLVFQGSWAFLTYKGANPDSIFEMGTTPGNGMAEVQSTISFPPDKGSMLTTEIGPTGKWSKLVVSQETPSNSAITYTPIGIKEDGDLDTLSQLVMQDSVADLSHIDSKIYPKIKILADFIASDDKQSPVLKSLGVDYNNIAELAMNYQVVSVDHDSIFQDEQNKLTFYVYNVGETNADSVSVKIELQKPDNSSVLLDEFITSVDSSAKKKFEFEYKIPASYGYGDMSFAITLDEGEKIAEFFKDNNFYQIPFYVKKDTSTDVDSAPKISSITFDDNIIVNNDFVSSTPKILFEFEGIDNLADISIKLNNKSIYNQDSDNIEYDSISKSMSYNFEPELGDSLYNLYVTVQSSNSVIPIRIDSLISFTVSNELMAMHIYNFPNPASDETDFTFRLAKIPEELDIRVYTVAGRLIKTFELQSYDLKTDINKIHWDLRDQDGDKIANGVYLYKIILRENDEVKHYTEKLAVVR